MRIGIGITTYNRPECLSKCLYQINKHTDRSNTILHVATDTDEDRRGVAFRKNECLRVLKDCDHIFLFDDDCYPIKDGWINEHILTGHNHLLFMDEKFHKIIHKGSIWSWNDCGGAFMFMTKECIYKVGAFNEIFKMWGFEHAEYSQRIHKAGLTPFPYITSEDADKYIYSCDYSEPNHKSSISNKEKQKYFDLNFPKFKEPIKNIYIPL